MWGGEDRGGSWLERVDLARRPAPTRGQVRPARRHEGASRMHHTACVMEEAGTRSAAKPMLGRGACLSIYPSSQPTSIAFGGPSLGAPMRPPHGSRGRQLLPERALQALHTGRAVFGVRAQPQQFVQAALTCMAIGRQSTTPCKGGVPLLPGLAPAHAAPTSTTATLDEVLLPRQSAQSRCQTQLGVLAAYSADRAAACWAVCAVCLAAPPGRGQGRRSPRAG